MVTRIDPGFTGIAAMRFLKLAEALHKRQEQGDFHHILDLAQREADWARNEPGLNGAFLRYEAAARVLVDLASLKWRISEKGYSVELYPPVIDQGKLTPDQICRSKAAVRQELKPQITAQFQQPSIRDFILRLEKPSAIAKHKSILNLIADPTELLVRLRPAIQAESHEERVLELRKQIRPYLQLVEEGKRDSFTNILLGDVWRYLRYSWSIPANSTPGRQLLYLIRDAAHPAHAVMGIASLNNCALTNKNRDKYIGWTTGEYINYWKQLADQLDADSAQLLIEEWKRLLAILDAAMQEIEIKGLCTEEEVINPSPSTIRRLQNASGRFYLLRREVLTCINSQQPLDQLELDEANLPPVSDEVLSLEGKGQTQIDPARRLLVAKKRASELAQLLQAKLTLIEWKEQLLNAQSLDFALSCEVVQLALSTVLSTLKSERSGTCMLEITTCGAIAPYQPLLAGKLTSLLLMSPQVAADYKKVYGHQPTIISSQLKNALREKESDLVFLGTTSLYDEGSSQYERLRLPAGTFAPDQPELKYRFLGKSSAYGTVHFSPKTTIILEQLLKEATGYKDVNSIFGEGPSPKLRKVRAALSELGFPNDALLKHHQKRRVYGVSLCNQALDFLLGKSVHLPDYIKNPENYPDATEAIADYWRERWLAMRLNHRPTLDSLKVANPWRLSDMVEVMLLEKEEPTELTNGSQAHKQVVSEDNEKNYETSPVCFWQGIAAKNSALYSDNLSFEQLDKLHVSQPLDDFLLEKVRDGWDVVLTGNAGDGKTHLLQRIKNITGDLQPQPEYILDAAEIIRLEEVDRIFDRWKQARNEGRQFLIAINEYPLYLLRQFNKQTSHPFAPLDEVDTQCKHRLIYSREETVHDKASITEEKVLVVDLSLRNPLNSDFARDLLHKLLDAPEIEQYAKQIRQKHDFRTNLNALKNEQVQSRLLNLFDQLCKSGNRVTIRDLWITVTRLLFMTSSDVSRADDGDFHHQYYHRLFETPEPTQLNELMSNLADPARHSHPHWDLKLETAGQTASEDWVVTRQEPRNFPREVMIQREPRGKELFKAIKRQFYFEHRHGNESFAIQSSTLLRYSDLLQQAQENSKRVLREIIGLINQAYCPQMRSEKDLYLWVGHRYHKQPSRAWISDTYCPSNLLSIQLPRLPNRLSNHLPYEADHFLLKYRNQSSELLGTSVTLKIDFDLFKALEDVGSGLPRNLLPEYAINRLDDFMHALLTQIEPDDSEFYTYHVERNETLRIRHNGQAFEEIERL